MEYKIDTNPPEFNDDNYPEIQKVPKSTKTTHQTMSNSYSITVIPETPMEELQQNQNEESIDFLSPSLVSKTTITNSTPQPLDTSTPNKEDNIDARLELHQIKLQPKEHHLTQAEKVIDNQ